MNIEIAYSTIAQFLEKSVHGKEGIISSYASLSEIKSHSVVFAKKIDEDILCMLNERGCDILAIVVPGYKDRLKCSYIVSDNPRLDYMRVIQKFFENDKLLSGIHVTTVIEEGALIGKNVYIGANCYIGNEVTIGDNTRILSNVIIEGKTVIGKSCYIKSGVVIGQPGFGFEKNGDGLPIHFPHLGKVLIGNDVYIGANTAIDRATLESTIIGDHVKIDNLVHVAHNVMIGNNSYIIAGTILGGGVHIGENCWIAPNVSIKQQLHVGNGALVGLGAVVLNDIECNTVVVGNPAKLLKK